VKVLSSLCKARPVFLVTGSDTGVGKTVFTGLLANYLRKSSFNLLLTKPFCSGGKNDIEFLKAANCGFFGSKLNYWYNDEPISPAS